MSEITQTTPPDLSDVLKRLRRDVAVNMNCVQIGIIEGFDPSDQTATVQIAFKQVLEERPDGTRILQDRPLLLKCPVMHLYGGSAYLSMPITTGDNCIVLFNDREIDNWFVAGGTQTPSTNRAHDIADALVIVGIRSLQNSITNYITNGVRLQNDDATAIEITENQIKAIADLFIHTGDVRIEGNLTIAGTTFGNTFGAWVIDADIEQASGRSINAGNGATGSFDVVNVVNGIVVGGS